ncbi:Gfo/Idh/MocA family protein [Brevibacillus borstelensis]|jgi:predicted dehydrogenase|uniref:Gfo/Idh/MocA family protein n=1 Tax=Brevibacillus borstelensis TaxID=45462 RepID=UPI002E1BE93E|nr:Gfo/Idh/MocA family oxidoreductase [Brevibacillus borstelensis]MED2007471.1 Gfo/Idh/MocA family oxidoreductase [Brevibacillus borstelensis]
MTTVGIIGLGPMGQRYIEAVQLLGNVKVAVMDLKEEAVETLKARSLDLEISSYTDHHDLLKSEALDILIIATNGPSHYSLFLDAVEYGVQRIICEKPIATSLFQAREMIRISKESGVLFAVNHAKRWASCSYELRKKIKENVIGPVESVMFSMGGGQMACNGTHFIDLVSYLLDQKVIQIYGFLNDEGIPNPRGEQFKDPGGYAILHFESGTRMFFEMTEDLGIPPLLVINGKYGRITMNDLKKTYVLEARTIEDRVLPVTRYGTELKVIESGILDRNIIQSSYELILNMLKDNLFDNPQHAVEALEVIIGIHESHRAGNKPITLPLTDEEAVSRQYMFT